MYAVLSSGGKQYRVEAGSELIIERIAGEPGASVTFDRVLLIGDGDDVTVGTPTVSGASVSGTLLGEQLGPKLVIFKFKQKVKYRRRTGHRQHLVRVRIDEINASGKRSTRAEAEPKANTEPKAKAPAKAEAPATTEAKPATRASATKATAAKKAPASKPRAAAAASAETEAKPARQPRARTSAKTASKASEAEAETPKRKPRATKAKAEKPAQE
jgi:large subunit ribosomal protein L21